MGLHLQLMAHISAGFLTCTQEIKVIEKRTEETRVALQHLEMNFINTACDDPGELSPP